MTMSASPSLNNNDDINECSTSYFQKTVTLQDWWLIKADNEFKGKRLAVAGFTPREKQKGALRVFYSAPITKVYDAFTLETADNIFVILQGFINKTRTIESGFLSGVFGHFVFGFPPNWEDCARKFMGKEVNSSTENTSEVKDSARNQDDSQNKNEENRLQSGSINFTTASLPHGFEAEICTNKSRATNEVSSSKPTTTGDPTNAVKSTKQTRKSSTKKLGEEVNVISSSFVQKETVNIASGRPVRSLRDTPQRKVVLGCSLKHKDQEETIGISKAILSSARKLINSSGNLRGDSQSKEKNEKISAKERVSSLNNARRKISFDRHDSPHTLGIKNIISPDSSSLKHSQSANTSEDEMLPVTQSRIPLVDSQNKNEEQNKLQSGGIDFITAFLPHGLEAEICTNKNQAVNEVSSTKPSTAGDLPNAEQSTKHTRKSSTKKLGEEAKITGSLFVRKETVNITSGRPVRCTRDIPQGKVVSGCSLKPKDQEVKSEAVKSLNLGNLQSSDDSICSQEKIGIAKANIRSERKVINSLGDLRADSQSKEKNEKINAKERVSSLDNARKKISFDRHDSPHRLERKNIISPESSSLKRSKSGRLLLPTLDFWRNQIPVYDVNRNLVGISEESEAETPSLGTKSGQKKRKKR